MDNWLFQKNSNYPRPVGYRTPEEEAQEAALKEQRLRDKACCHAAFPKWRKQQSDTYIVALFDGDASRFPPEYIIEQRFQSTVWPHLSEEERQQYAGWTAS